MTAAKRRTSESCARRAFGALLVLLCALAASPASASDGWAIPGTDAKLTLSGFVKVDGIYDFDAIGDHSQFNPFSIPTDGSEGSGTNFQVKTSRLGLEITRPKTATFRRLYLEIDFFTTSGAPRIRQANFDLGRFRIGQDWTTLTNNGARPPTLDFESPIGFVTQRSPLVRYTQPFGREWELAIAAEFNPPTADTTLVAAIPGEMRPVVPDGVARLYFHRAQAEISLHAIVRSLRYVTDAGTTIGEPAFGGSLTARATIAPWLTMYSQAIVGAGIGSYRGGFDLGYDVDGTIHAIRSGGGTLALTVHWLPKRLLESTVTGSFVRRFDAYEAAGEKTNLAGTYFAANIVGRPYPGVELGIEYLQGTHRTADDGFGRAHRVQISATAHLP